MALFDKVNIIKNLIEVIIKVLPVIDKCLDYILTLETK